MEHDIQSTSATPPSNPAAGLDLIDHTQVHGEPSRLKTGDVTDVRVIGVDQNTGQPATLSICGVNQLNDRRAKIIAVSEHASRYRAEMLPAEKPAKI